MRNAALPRAVAVLSVPRRTEPKQNAAAGGIGSGSQAAKRVFGRAARPATVWSPHTIAVSISARLAPRIFQSVVFSSFPSPFGSSSPASLLGRPAIGQHPMFAVVRRLQALVRIPFLFVSPVARAQPDTRALR